MNGLHDTALILEKFTKGLFWNMDTQKLDFSRDKKLVVQRVLEAGLESDFSVLRTLYSDTYIKNNAVRMENLPKNLSFT